LYKKEKYLNGDKLGVWASGKYLDISADESILETEWNELVACTPFVVCSFGLGTKTGAVADWVCSDSGWAKIQKIFFWKIFLFFILITCLMTMMMMMMMVIMTFFNF
jgi:hypothetical protein